MRINLKQLIIIVIIIGISFGYARADKQELMNKLNKYIHMDMNSVPISTVLKQIGEQIQAEIVLSDEAKWKLPHGEMTQISVQLNGTVSETLEQMLNTFFMRYAIGNDQIVIYPRPELDHIIGKPTPEQFESLRKIYTIVLTFPDKTSSTEYKSETQTLITNGLGFKFSPYEIPDLIFNVVLSRGITKISQPGDFVFLLEQVGDKTGRNKWYISRTDSINQTPVITFVNENEFRQAKINQVVDISFQDQKAEDIINMLATWAGSELEVNKHHPSWLQEKITVEMLNTTLMDALDKLVSSLNGKISFLPAGDSYSIKIEGRLGDLVTNIAIATLPTGATTNTGGTTSGTTGATMSTRGRTTGTRDPITGVPGTTTSFNYRPPVTGSSSEGYVGKISIPMDGGAYFIEFMLRESDLTEELRKLRAEKLQAIMEQIGQSEETN